MFDVPLTRHDDRYACAEEWLAIVKRLWTEDEDFDHDGRYYRIRKGYLQPKPIQKPYPAIMNAGSSERGRHFAAKNCDLVYTVLRTHDIDACTAHVAAYHRLAREEYGRAIRVWTLATIVQGETEKEARHFSTIMSTRRATGSPPAMSSPPWPRRSTSAIIRPNAPAP